MKQEMAGFFSGVGLQLVLGNTYLLTKNTDPKPNWASQLGEALDEVLLMKCRADKVCI